MGPMTLGVGSVFTASDTHSITLGPLQLDTGMARETKGKLVSWKRLWDGSQKTTGSVFSLPRAGGSGTARSDTTCLQHGDNAALDGTEMDTRREGA